MRRGMMLHACSVQHVQAASAALQAGINAAAAKEASYARGSGMHMRSDVQCAYAAMLFDAMLTLPAAACLP